MPGVFAALVSIIYIPTAMKNNGFPADYLPSKEVWETGAAGKIVADAVAPGAGQEWRANYG